MSENEVFPVNSDMADSSWISTKNIKKCMRNLSGRLLG